jgi:hypothetical protein
MPGGGVPREEALHRAPGAPDALAVHEAVATSVGPCIRRLKAVGRSPLVVNTRLSEER